MLKERFDSRTLRTPKCPNPDKSYRKRGTADDDVHFNHGCDGRD